PIASRHGDSLMTAEDGFVHSILENPDDDAPRLVFADWLKEQGRAAHAELIHVQCALARMPKSGRKELAAREKELLAQPEFHPKWPPDVPKPDMEGSPVLKYVRGFIPTIHVLDGEPMAPEWK